MADTRYIEKVQQQREHARPKMRRLLALEQIADELHETNELLRQMALQLERMLKQSK